MHRRWSVLIQPRVVCITSMVFMSLVAVAEMLPTIRFSTGEEPITLGQRREDSKLLDAIKQRILADLGLTRVPDVSRAAISSEKMEAMIELYKRSVQEEDEDDDEDDDGSTNSKRHSVERIYSFSAKGTSESRTLHDGNGMIRQKLLFPLDLTSQFSGSKVSLKSAKLKIRGFQTGSKPKILIYKVINNSPSSNASLDLVIAHTVQSNSSYLANVDISDSIQTWTNELTDLKLVLVVELLNCSVSVANDDTTYAKSQDPAILNILVSESPNRVKRSNPIPYDFSNDTSLDCTQGFRTKMCCRRALRLSFDDLGWDWIIQPTKFETFYCKGKCQSETKNFANTHALMQSILHRKNHRVPNPCCAPKKFKSMTMLHYDDNFPPNLVLTKQKGMIVKECACT